MGYFCVSEGESLEEKLTAAAANLELLKDDLSYDYLIDFALKYIEDCLEISKRNSIGDSK